MVGREEVWNMNLQPDAYEDEEMNQIHFGSPSVWWRAPGFIFNLSRIPRSQLSQQLFF